MSSATYGICLRLGQLPLPPKTDWDEDLSIRNYSIIWGLISRWGREWGVKAGKWRKPGHGASLSRLALWAGWARPAGDLWEGTWRRQQSCPPRPPTNSSQSSAVSRGIKGQALSARPTPTAKLWRPPKVVCMWNLWAPRCWELRGCGQGTGRVGRCVLSCNNWKQFTSPPGSHHHRGELGGRLKPFWFLLY